MSSRLSTGPTFIEELDSALAEEHPMPEHTAASIPMSWTNGSTTVAVDGVLVGIRPLPNHGPLILEIRVERDAMVRRTS
jgi:hypothetical protein